MKNTDAAVSGERIFRVETADHVATVRMNRPPANAQNRVFRQECIETFDRLADEPEVRAIVLTGNGRVFSAGADLTDRPDPGELGAYRWHNRLMLDCFDSVLACPKPVVAAIDGPAIAAGFVLASVCDILIASERAWISLPEAAVGLAGGVRHALRHFGQSDARLALFTARRLVAADLLQMRVISACTAESELVPHAQEIAAEIARNAPLAVEAAKRSFMLSEELSVHSAYSYEQSQTAVLSRTEDAVEALAAFREKRRPEFRGS
jgi:enoyl-CoA hydratase/carnithine racemase